jgi:hypothetical protein
MDLYLRKSDQGQLGPEIYRVILKDDGDEVEIGSIRNHRRPWWSLLSHPQGSVGGDRQGGAAATGRWPC